MSIRPLLQALRTFLSGVLALGLLVFVPAGSLRYWQGWLYIVVVMASISATGLYLATHDPALLERRKKGGPLAEEKVTQKVIISLAMLGYAILVSFSAHDVRYGWSSMPPLVSILGALCVLVGFLIAFAVLKENSFGGATIKTFENQRVISSGPYALVRHPMYAGAIFMAIGTPLTLGSWWGLLLLPLMAPLLMWRILDEEQLLNQELPGYVEYTQKVRYRLVPNLW